MLIGKVNFKHNPFIIYRFLLFNIDASPEQLAMSQTSIERMVMAKIYTAALYPNGQIDVQRDQ
jgi:hypothetical protein